MEPLKQPSCPLQARQQCMWKATRGSSLPETEYSSKRDQGFRKSIHPSGLGCTELVCSVLQLINLCDFLDEWEAMPHFSLKLSLDKYKLQRRQPGQLAEKGLSGSENLGIQGKTRLQRGGA